jgi:hypothetical protein
VTAALLVVPGVAHAETPQLPDPGSVVQRVEGSGQDVRDALGNVLTIPEVTIPALGGTTTDGTPGAGATPTFTPPDLGPLQALFDALGVPEQCTTAITGDLVEIVSSIPATVQAIVTQLQAALEAVQKDPGSLPDVFQAQIMTLLGGLGGAPGADADEDGVPLITAVEDLVADFLANCLPKPQTTAPTSLAPAAQQTTPPPAAPLTTAPAAPVAYLGYAPTGVGTDDSADSTPLLALAGVLLLGGGVAGTWMRLRRGVSSRG